MSTKVYGCSDDLIEVEGEARGEVGCYGTDDREKGVLMIFSDGTLLEVKFGKAGMSVWGIQIIKQGDLFEKIDFCCDEDLEPHSDVVTFKDGIKWVYAATNDWGKVE